MQSSSVAGVQAETLGSWQSNVHRAVLDVPQVVSQASRQGDVLVMPVADEQVPAYERDLGDELVLAVVAEQVLRLRHGHGLG